VGERHIIMYGNKNFFQVKEPRLSHSTLFARPESARVRGESLHLVPEIIGDANRMSLIAGGGSFEKDLYGGVGSGCARISPHRGGQ